MKEELKSIGLTDGEIEVYLALLKLGESTNSPIARHSQLQSSTVYYCLNTLIEKGFVTYILKGDRRHFRAVDPNNILKIIEEKEKDFLNNKEKLSRIIPELKHLEKMIEETTTAEVFDGPRGIQMVFRQIFDELKKGDQYEAFVIEQSLEDPKDMEFLFTKHNKELKSKGIKLRLLAHERMREVFKKIYGEKFLDLYQEIRYVSQVIPIGITIYKNYSITHVSEKNRPIAIRVKNERLAEMYRNHFNFLWKMAKK